MTSIPLDTRICNITRRVRIEIDLSAMNARVCAYSKEAMSLYVCTQNGCLIASEIEVVSASVDPYLSLPR